MREKNENKIEFLDMDAVRSLHHHHHRSLVRCLHLIIGSRVLHARPPTVINGRQRGREGESERVTLPQLHRINYYIQIQFTLHRAIESHEWIAVI